MTVQLPELPQYWVWNVEYAPGGFFKISAYHSVIKSQQASETVSPKDDDDVDELFNWAYESIAVKAWEMTSKDRVKTRLDQHLEALGFYDR